MLQTSEKIIPLNKVSNLKAVKVEKVNKAEIFKYAIRGEFEIRKTSLSLKDDEAITFLWALSKGYLNTCRGFIYKDNKKYWLVKTTIKTKQELSKGEIVDEKTEQEFTKADEQLKAFREARAEYLKSHQKDVQMIQKLIRDTESRRQKISALSR